MTLKDKLNQSTIDLLRKADSEAQKAARKFKDPYDNCLLCRYSDIEPNQCARVLEKLGFHGIARHIDAHFPLVFCDYPHSKRIEHGTRGKYVANPMSVPGWCPKK